MAGAETTTRQRRRPKAPSLWVLAAGLLAVAGPAFVGASRVGDDIDRLERAESLSFQLEARAGEERSRLVNKILSVAERQRSGVAAELHDGPHPGPDPARVLLERGRLRLHPGAGRGRPAAARRRPGGPWRRGAGAAADHGHPTAAVLEERGLVSALCDYVEVVREQAGISCTLSAKLPERLPGDQEIVLYRVELAGGS